MTAQTLSCTSIDNTLISNIDTTNIKHCLLKKTKSIFYLYVGSNDFKTG